MNPYYTHTANVPPPVTRAISSSIRAEYDLIAAGFDTVFQQGISGALPGINAGTAGMTPSNNGTVAGWIAVTNIPFTQVAGTTQAAVAGTAYLLINVAASTVTLPATPSANDKVIVKIGNGLATNVINPNGNTIEGVAGNMTIDNAYAVVNLQYLNSSWRLV